MGPLIADAPKYVLDCYALLAYLEGGPGAERVRELMERARKQQAGLAAPVLAMAEAVAVVERERGLTCAQMTLGRLWDLPISRHEAGEGLALAAARLRARWAVPLSDCVAVALAQQLGATLVTGNRVLEPVGDVVAIEWLGGAAG